MTRTCSDTAVGPRPRDRTACRISGILHARPLDVRAFVAAFLENAGEIGLTEAETINAAIILGEALNNVVEHACPDQPGARIDVRVRKGPCGVVITLCDPGRPLPLALRRRRSRQQRPLRTPSSLPEGGFGWQLIDELSHRVRYLRLGRRNYLAICLASEDTRSTERDMAHA